MEHTDDIVCSLKKLGLAITKYLENKTEENWELAWTMATTMDAKENLGWNAMPSIEFLIEEWNSMPLISNGK